LVGPAVLNPAPAIIITTTAVNPVCPGGLGRIDLIATGGVGNLTYAWSNGATTQNISDLRAGAYNVTVTDANGCRQVSENISINDPQDFVVTLSPTDILCYGQANGQVTLTVTGNGPFTYSWSNGATTQNIANLNGRGGSEYSITN